MSHSSDSPRWFQAPAAAIVCLLMDYLSKRWAESSLSLHTPETFIPGVINLNLTSNTGAAFSIGKDFGIGMTMIATLVTIGIVTWYIFREREQNKPHVVERIGIGCVIGGALGNLLDRYTQGYVTDFLDFAFIDFPVFNVADAMINVGIVLILFAHIFLWSKPKAENKVSANEEITNE